LGARKRGGKGEAAARGATGRARRRRKARIGQGEFSGKGKRSKV